jgi:hypothetical protein
MKFDIKRKKINIFKLDKNYYFKQFLDDKELFEELSAYYNETKYRFECKTAAERNKIMKTLYHAGYEPIQIDRFQDYLVKIDRYQKYGPILRNSIEYTELGSDRIFLMKDALSVEQAIEDGAERYTDAIESDRLLL